MYSDLGIAVPLNLTLCKRNGLVTRYYIVELSKWLSTIEKNSISNCQA